MASFALCIPRETLLPDHAPLRTSVLVAAAAAGLHLPDSPNSCVCETLLMPLPSKSHCLDPWPSSTPHGGRQRRFAAFHRKRAA